MRESLLEKYVVKSCKQAGIITRKFSSPSQRGVPDRILIASGGRVVFLELKHPNGGGVLSQLQRAEFALLRANNVEIYVTSEKRVIDKIIDSLINDPSPAGCDNAPVRVQPYLFDCKDGVWKNDNLFKRANRL